MSGRSGSTPNLPGGFAPAEASGSPLPKSAPQAAAVGVGLRQSVVSGAIWSVAQVVGSKVVALGGQILLARLLLPEEFGTVGLAYVVFSFAVVFQQIGINEILVQRGKHFARWANAGFWISLTAATITALLMIAAAPLAADIYHAPHLAGVIVVIALSVPLGAMNNVAIARLQIDLRFRRISAIYFYANASQTILSVALAAVGFGVYSFVIPRVIVNAAQTVVLWKEQASFILPRLQLRRWKFVLTDSKFIFLSWIFYAVIWQCDNMSLGFWHTAARVGIYYFAFNLTMQMNTLFTQSIWPVLLPALSRMQENPAHQLHSYLGAARILAAVSTPFCLLLAVLAEPTIRVVFGSKWVEAIPVVQVLALGMTFSVVGATENILLQAQGGFKTLAIISGALAALFLAMVLPTAHIPGVRGVFAVAIAVAVFHAIMGPVNMYSGIRGLGGRLRDLAGIYLPALIPGVICVGIAALAGMWLSNTLGGNIVHIALTGCLGLGLYAIALRIAVPSVWMELKERSKQIAGRIIKRPAAE